MGKSVTIFSLFIFTLLSAILLSSLYYRTTLGTLTTNGNATVHAQVGEFTLNLSGIASPFASIVLTSDGVFYRATVADAQGRFSLTGILINRGFSHFCLTHIDYRRLGESVTCFDIPPAQASVTMDGIFLPPTIGLQRTTIAAGEDGIIFGYTMPGSTVTIHLQNGRVVTVTADSTGYYEAVLENLPAGVYELYATAVYNLQPSEEPDNRVQLTALSFWEQIWKFIRDIWKNIVDWFVDLGLGPLWLILPLLPALFYLILKIWPEHFTIIYDSKMYAFLARKDKKLHHAWFMGY